MSADVHSFDASSRLQHVTQRKAGQAILAHVQGLQDKLKASGVAAELPADAGPGKHRRAAKTPLQVKRADCMQLQLICCMHSWVYAERPKDAIAQLA